MNTTAFACAISTVLGAAGPAWASVEEADLARLTTLNPGMSSKAMTETIEYLALQSGKAYDAALEEALGAAETSIIEAAPPEFTKDGASVQSSPAGGPHVIGIARHHGGVFYLPKWTGINHGRSGIFHNFNTIVEAPGPNRLSRHTSTSGYNVANGSQKQFVFVTDAKGYAASNCARSHYVGTSYNTNFSNNRYTSGNMNCSLLVWAAYLMTSNTKLDANTGPSVYPWDIRNSPNTSTYQTF